MTDNAASSKLTCKSCGKTFAPPKGLAREALAALVEEESARCRRLDEVGRQRQALAARSQEGFAGLIGDEAVDTVDLVAQRKSLAQLDATLKAEVEALTQLMMHVPGNS
jgi:hypothetical protein